MIEPKSRGEKEKLPDERESVTRKFVMPRSEQDPFRLYVTVGLHEDGRPGEVFLTADKAGSFERGLLNALGIAISIGLQHGVPLEQFVSKLKGIRFEPNGFTGDKMFPNVASPLDWVARWLESKFVKRGDGQRNDG
jgi:ribonucleoside-diphosphate reductase alpha chain